MARTALGSLAALVGLALLVLFPVALSTPARAASLRVAANGVDSAQCGGKKAPCRSLGQAIANARDGDKIQVGPGHYGNLNQDYDFDDAGEEHRAEVDTGCRCAVEIDKRLTISSTHGPELTLIDAGGETGTHSRATDVVEIAASGVVFGGSGKGFTLTGGYQGIEVAPSAEKVEVSGNVAVANEIGFSAPDGRGVKFSQNVAVANAGTGFALACADPAAACLGEHNQALGNGGNGFFLRGAVDAAGNAALTNGLDGFLASGEGLVLASNVSSANGASGFRLQGKASILEGNTAVGNDAAGVEMGGDLFVEDAGHALSNNQLVGNVSAGVHMRRLTRLPSVLRGNTLFGNYGFQAGFCDVLSEKSYAGADELVDNWWGTPDGPYDGHTTGAPISMTGGYCDVYGGRLSLEGHLEKPPKGHKKSKKSKLPW